MIHYKELPDQELIELLRVDDTRAFAEIMKRYRAPLISFAGNKLGDLPHAEDLVSDVFTYIWEKRDVLVINSNFRGFLFKAVRNGVLAHFRRQKIQREYLDYAMVMAVTEQDRTDHKVRHEELNRYIEKEIAALPKNMREVFCLNRKGNLSRKEIAAQLNMPENSVRTNMGRALKILKRRLRWIL